MRRGWSWRHGGSGNKGQFKGLWPLWHEKNVDHVRIYDGAGGRWEHREFLLRRQGASSFSWLFIPTAHDLSHVRAKGALYHCSLSPEPTKRIEETRCDSWGDKFTVVTYKLAAWDSPLRRYKQVFVVVCILIT